MLMRTLRQVGCDDQLHPLHSTLQAPFGSTWGLMLGKQCGLGGRTLDQAETGCWPYLGQGSNGGLRLPLGSHQAGGLLLG